MHYFIFPSQDTWISSGSNKIDGTSYTDQNFGKDQILEIKKEFHNLSYDHSTRGLIQFNLTDLQSKITQSLIPSASAKYSLRLYEAEGNRELSQEYKLIVHPISGSWDEGVGKFGDNPKVTNGCSWEYRFNKPNSTPLEWRDVNNTRVYGGTFYSSSIAIADNPYSATSGSQTFSYQSPDVNVDVTDIVNHWLDGRIPNNGLILKFSGSQETDNETFGQLKFFSSDTHTIYSPRLEVKWDDHKGYSTDETGSMSVLDLTGGTDVLLYMKGLRDYYRETDKVKFRVSARKRYVKKTFSDSYAVNSLTGSYISEGSGSYSIIDTATGETVVPFSAYTSMSIDTTSNYFTQYMNGFHPDRVYRILYKLKYDDGQEIIYDEDFDFKIKRV
tara:strand:- start:1247 stop:2404 length:1158 start_codon:yes stop_codon:yes gene_type:complete